MGSKLWFLFIGLLASLTFQACSPVSFSVAASEGGPQPLGEDMIKSLEPTLAIRGFGCIECHAKVDSNIVSDYGYGSSYFFGESLGGDWWKSGSPYGDHDQSLKTTQFSSTSKFFVPKVTFSSAMQTATTKTTLAEYVSSQLANSIHASSQSAKVEEVDSIYIGAPTDVQIRSAFKMSTSTRIVFKPSRSSLSNNYSGLKDEGTFFRNSGTLDCDGDIALKGPLYLENLNLRTDKGCRLYVMGSVFIYGPITYLSSDANRNLQITSTRTIAMGLGVTKQNDAFCLPGAEWYSNNNVDNSFTKRISTIWTVPAQFSRVISSPQDYAAMVEAEATTVQSKMGTFKDASCRPETRNVSYERILLNASHIHSRYTGDVKGTIIAEYALISLKNFKFTFDPVFREVDVLPYISRTTYLSVK